MPKLFNCPRCLDTQRGKCKFCYYKIFKLDRKKERSKFLKQLHTAAKTTQMETFGSEAVDKAVKQEYGPWLDK